MNKSDLIALLKSADCGSDELNVAYYEWRYPEYVIAYHKYMKGAYRFADPYDGALHPKIECIPLRDVSNSVDAALGEIPKCSYLLMDYDTDKKEKNNTTLMWHGKDSADRVAGNGKHKSLPIAILLAVVEAAL